MWPCARAARRRCAASPRVTLRAKTSSGPGRGGRRGRVSLHLRRAPRRSRRSPPSCRDSDPAGDLGGGVPVVACDHEDADAGAVAACDCVGHLGPRRVEQADEPEQDSSCSASSRRAGGGPRRQPPARDARGRGAPARPSVEASSTQARGRVVEWDGGRPGADQRRPLESSSGAPFAWTVSAAVLALVDRRHQAERGVEAVHAPSAGVLAPRGMDVDAERARRLEERLPRSPPHATFRPVRRPVRPCCTRRAPVRGGRGQGSAPAVELGSLSSSRSTSPSGVQTRTGRIRFSVSVPVLSVQMTVVEPRVSSAESRLTRAPRRASAPTPTASDNVIVGSSPSGTFATMRPIAKLKASPRGGRRRAKPTGRNASPPTRATRAISQATRRTSTLERALLGRVPLGERRDPPELGPHAGREDEGPGLAAEAVVPLKTRSRASSSGPVVSIRSAERYTGCDSPVSAERSSSTPPSSSRASAEMRSPSGGR